MDFIKKHSTQILVHILFWMLFIFVSLFMFSEYYWKENPFLQYLSILVVIVYANNLFLLPFFVKNKWYLLYTLVFALISFYATQVYCYVFAQCGCSIRKCLSDYLWQTITPLIFFSFIWIFFRYITQQEEVKKIEQERTEMELKFLKSQINPHVLFNNLNTIYSYSIEKPNETPDLILKLSDNLKHVLYESNTSVVSLEKELHFIDNYIEFQRIRTQGVKTISYNTAVDKNGYKIAPLLLITVIENAFKHSSANSIIDLQIQVKEDILTCVCSNHFKESSNQNTDAIGLQNLQKRLDLLYLNKHELKIEKTDKFSVTLKLNLL